jgi:hypothetical protein
VGEEVARSRQAIEAPAQVLPFVSEWAGLRRELTHRYEVWSDVECSLRHPGVLRCAQDGHVTHFPGMRPPGILSCLITT